MGHDGVEPIDPRPWLAGGPAFGGEKSGGNPRFGQWLALAHDRLMNVDAGRADVGEGRDELKIVAEPGGLQIFDRGLGNGINPGPGGKRGGLVDPRGAQHVGAGALHIFEVIGVIDDPGGVGILEIDGQGEVVLRPDEAAAIGLVEGTCYHLSNLTNRPSVVRFFTILI